jgi:hypothetical protein
MKTPPLGKEGGVSFFRIKQLRIKRNGNRTKPGRGQRTKPASFGNSHWRDGAFVSTAASRNRAHGPQGASCEGTADSAPYLACGGGSPAHRSKDRTMSARVTLPDPVEVAKFWKNRRRNESVHVSLSEYEGHCLINVRVYCTGTDGIDRPTPRGVALSIRKLSELSRALVRAEAQAKALGLIEGETADE